VSEPSPPSWRASAWIENFARDGFGKPSVLTEIKSGSQPTHRWREPDSNPRSPVRKLAPDVGTPTIIDGMRRRCDAAPKVRFASDSSLEREGFEPSVPRAKTTPPVLLRARRGKLTGHSPPMLYAELPGRGGSPYWAWARHLVRNGAVLGAESFDRPQAAAASVR